MSKIVMVASFFSIIWMTEKRNMLGFFISVFMLLLCIVLVACLSPKNEDSYRL